MILARKVQVFYDPGMATSVVPSAHSERGSIAAAAPAAVRLGFGLGGSVLAIDIADDAALCLLRDAYSPMRCEPAGARAHAMLRRLADGRLHARYGRLGLRLENGGDPVPIRAAYHATREIFARFAVERPHTIALYGSLFEINGGAVLVLGPTMIGKTLLALHAANAGARFLGDETALVSLLDGDAYAMPRRPSLRESGVPLLPTARMRSAVLKSQTFFQTDRGRFWYALDEQALAGMQPNARTYPLRAVCILSARSEQPHMRRLDVATGVPLLAQRAYVRPTSLAELGSLRRATRHAIFFEMTLGTPQHSSELLLQEVRACA
jgi:hypothetical protein